MNRFLLPDDIDERALRSGLADAHSLVLTPPTHHTVTYLDTFDWRLHNAGLVLVEERGRRRNLVLMEAGGEPLVVATKTTPKLPEDLPDGHIAKTVAPAMDIRALIPVGSVRTERREGRIENADGNIVTRLRLERIEVPAAVDEDSQDAFTALSADRPETLGVLRAGDGVAELPAHDLAAAAAARGRVPGDYTSKVVIPLDADRPACDSMRTILGELLDTLEANVPGTIADLDTEFLHDLRVACRRTRSAITQLKGVLDPEAIAAFNAEFKWLGSATGELRDLDVYLLEMPVYRSMLPASVVGDLDPLVSLIAAERTRAHRSVARALRSARFRRVVADWRACLGEIGPAPGEAATGPTASLAGDRITKAYRRILKKGSGLGENPPAAALHRLRIDAKKLRYLLEFFRSLYPKREIAARIKELKRLQDILGGFNDMEVQRNRLAGFAETLHADPSVKARVLLTMGRVAGALETRQETYRLAFHDTFVEFSGPAVRTAYGRLFRTKESR
ncbi:MAG: CHAD domain-containing protein [Thermoanaerobaculales bacterium]|nr:CHAD domain-containing protein [Thermoanaerobaculales bacterium]